jgi:hypothetical protein
MRKQLGQRLQIGRADVAHQPEREPPSHIDTEIAPDTPTLVRLVPEKPGTYPFHCDVFCGSGHEEMTGLIVVKP